MMEPVGDDAAKAAESTGVRLHRGVTSAGWAPKRPWTETVEAYISRLKRCAAHCNEKYDISGLCKEYPWRLHELQNREGDRLPK